MAQDSGSGDPSKGNVGASGQLDAVVIRKDGARENVTPHPIVAAIGKFFQNLNPFK